MEDNERSFADFLVESGALAFGEFETKSGRVSPYFLNLGAVRTGPAVLDLARHYARAIRERIPGPVDFLFGPAYKGIPLVVATSMVLYQEYGIEVGFAYDRKERKDHGEGGWLVGHRPRDGERGVVLEDVTTAGTSIRQTVPRLLELARIELAGLVVALDRQERGQGSESALTELSREFRMPVVPLATIEGIVAALAGREVDGRRVIGAQDLERIRAYRERYGAS